MNFTTKSLMLLTAWVAWCVFAVTSGQLWAYDTTQILGWLIVSSTLALPMVTEIESRRFWAVYAVTTATFLILSASGNETLIRVTNTIARRLVDLHVWAFGNQEGLGNAYLKTNIVGILTRLHCAPLLGVFSAFVWKFLASTPPRTKAG